MPYWILSTDGKSYGPADEAVLRRWIAEGRVTPGTPVGAGADGPWAEARTVPEVSELFVTAAAPTDVPGEGPGATVAPPTSPAGMRTTAVPAGWPPSELALPLLISGIFHLLYGASLVGGSCFGGLFTFGWGCCFGICGAPAIVLGALEVSHYSQRATMEPQRWLDRAKIFAIIDVCCILWGNVVAIVCGIVVLTQLDGARMRLGGPQR